MKLADLAQDDMQDDMDHIPEPYRITDEEAQGVISLDSQEIEVIEEVQNGN